MSLLKTIFPNLTTARNESRARDNEKIDLINRDEVINGLLPIEFQCKTTCKGVNYSSILDSMPGRVFKCILHRQTIKSNKNFLSKGEYAILPMEDFLKILKKAYCND